MEGERGKVGGKDRTKLRTKQAYLSDSQEQEPSSSLVFQHKKPRLGRMFQAGRVGLRGLDL